MQKMKMYFICCIIVACVVGCKLTPEKLQEKTKLIAPQVQAIAKAVTDQDLKGDDGLLKFVALLQAGNAASAPINPYAVPVGAGLAVLTAVMGFVAKKKNDEAKKSDAKYRSHKEGVALTIKQIAASPDSQTAQTAGTIDKVLYENIGKAREKNGV